MHSHVMKCGVNCVYPSFSKLCAIGLKSRRNAFCVSHLYPHSSFVSIHSSHSTRESGCGSTSCQSIVPTTVSPFEIADSNSSPSTFRTKAVGMLMSRTYLPVSASAAASIVTSGSSTSSTMSTASAPAFCAFITFSVNAHPPRSRIRITPSRAFARGTSTRVPFPHANRCVGSVGYANRPEREAP